MKTIKQLLEKINKEKQEILKDYENEVKQGNRFCEVMAKRYDFLRDMEEYIKEEVQ